MALFVVQRGASAYTRPTYVDRPLIHFLDDRTVNLDDRSTPSPKFLQRDRLGQGIWKPLPFS